MRFLVLALTLSGFSFGLAGCSGTRDMYQAAIAKETASAADDWNESVKWGYCDSVSLGSMWRECGYDLNSSCWRQRAGTCSGVPSSPPAALGEPSE